MHFLMGLFKSEIIPEEHVQLRILYLFAFHKAVYLFQIEMLVKQAPKNIVNTFLNGYFHIKQLENDICGHLGYKAISTITDCATL